MRGNGGGNVSPQIIERLRREIAMITIARNTSYAPNPDGTIIGPKVMLLDEFSASDGDIVAYRFKKYKLGPVIGKRTWGGVVGIRGTLPLLDGGFLNRPEFSRYDVEGKEWIMEGKGVEPDIVVDNDPAKEFAGIDEQLNKAIEVIKDLMTKNPPKLAPPPPVSGQEQVRVPDDRRSDGPRARRFLRKAPGTPVYGDERREQPFESGVRDERNHVERDEVLPHQRKRREDPWTASAASRASSISTASLRSVRGSRSRGSLPPAAGSTRGLPPRAGTVRMPLPFYSASASQAPGFSCTNPSKHGNGPPSLSIMEKSAERIHIIAPLLARSPWQKFCQSRVRLSDPGRTMDRLQEWKDSVLFPSVPADATSAQRVTFAKMSEVSKFFGGQSLGVAAPAQPAVEPALPLVGIPSTPAPPAAAVPKKKNKEGC